MTRVHLPIGGDVELEAYLEEKGGGGSLPSPITDPVLIATTGSDSVPFTATPGSGATAAGTNVIQANDDAGYPVFYVQADGGAKFTLVGAGDIMTIYNDGGGNGEVNIGSLGPTGAKLGFFGGSPVNQPSVPQTSPGVQDVIDALVALGLVAQSDG